MSAAGSIIIQQDLFDFLNLDLAILSQQDPDATDISVANTQRAIDKAEARIKAKLNNFYTMPLAVGGTPIISATASIAYPLLVTIGCQYAGFWLNKWRAVQGLGDQLSQSAIDMIAVAWEKDADAELDLMNRYAMGYSDGLAVDLDLRSDAPRSVEGGGGGNVPAIRGYRAQPCGRRWVNGCWC